MKTPFFAFGQTLPEYAVPVFNERAVRASAGILFVFAFASFAQALLQGSHGSGMEHAQPFLRALRVLRVRLQ